jgi:hypothetical protein
MSQVGISLGSRLPFFPVRNLTARIGPDILHANMRDGSRMNDQSRRDADETASVFELLLNAQNVYAPYRELATIARLAAENPPPQPSQPSWDHPLGLVIRTTK